jgi:hypothetical protein
MQVVFDRINGNNKTFVLKRDDGNNTGFSASNLLYNIPEGYHTITVKASLGDFGTDT